MFQYKKMNNKNLNIFKKGGSHSANPLGGIPQGIGANGKPNLVEQDETSYDSNSGKYIFSDNVSVDLVKEFSLPTYVKNKSFADASKLIDKKFKDRNDKTSLATKDELMNRLTEAQEYVKEKESLNNPQPEANQFGDGGDLVTGGLKMGADALLPGSSALIDPLMGLGKDLFGIGKEDELNAFNDQTQGYRNNSLNTFALGGNLNGPGDKYKIKKGDTLSGISKQFGLNMNDLAARNNIAKDEMDLIYAGDTLNLGNRKPLKPVTPISASDTLSLPALKKLNPSPLEGRLNSNTTTEPVLTDKTKTPSKLKDLATKALRFAPMISNLSQLNNLKKPAYETLDRLDAKYKKDYVDEKALTNQVNEQYGGTAERLANASGGNTSSLRANLLGAQLNKSKALSQAFLQADNINRQQNDTAQKFNLGVDTTNLKQSNLENDINAKNKGAYETNKSNLMTKLGNNLGALGKEGSQMKAIAKMYGYTWDGQYLRDKDGKKIDPKNLKTKKG